MPDRVRRASQRASFLAILALLAIAAAGPSAVVAGGPSLLAPADRPIPREPQPRDAAGYRMPFAPDLQVKIHQGWNSTFSHNGRAAYAYDFGLQEGTPVLAAAGGIVAWTHDGETECGGWELKRDVNYVTIYHPDGSATHYGHLESVSVEVGQVVVAGQRIGRSGKTGYSGCLPHLHFARQEQGAPVTQSLPVYFDAYPGRELLNGETVSAIAPACSRADAAAPLEAFCATYSPLAPIDLTPEASIKVTDGKAQQGDGLTPGTTTDGAAPGAPAARRPTATTPGPAYFSRLEPAIDFDWAERAPGGYWLDKPTEGFLAHWSGQFTFESRGTYRILVSATDRVRVVIDGLTVFNYGSEHADPRYLQAYLPLAPGLHLIEVDHVDLDGQGMLSLAWDLPDAKDGRWGGCGPVNLSVADC